MFGFTDPLGSSIKVDWSLYGGAEHTSPPSSSSRSTAIEPTSQSSVSRSHSIASHSSHSSRSATPSTQSQKGRASSTPLTSDDDGHDDNGNDDDDDHEDHDEVARLVGASPKRSSVANFTSSAQQQQHSSARPSPALERDGRRWLPPIATTPQDPADFLWLHTEEPHRSRRIAILAAHPEVRKLMGHEPLTKYISFGVLVLQVSLAVLVARLGWHPFGWRTLLLAYVVGGTANQNTFLAIHEITHNLAFKGIRANRLWAILVNCAIGVPYAMAFKPYHLEHHKHLGEDGIDTDLPTRLELVCLNNVFGKAFFATFQIFFYALRPGFVRAQRPTRWHLLNLTAQLLFNVLLVRLAGWPALLYLLLSSFFAGSLHPCAAHFLAEHYTVHPVQQETWSYYGALNVLAYNVGYHNEHHDFPSVPWTRLPRLREVASGFYDVLPCHTSWPMVTVRFVLGREMGLEGRVKRVARGKEAM